MEQKSFFSALRLSSHKVVMSSGSSELCRVCASYMYDCNGVQTGRGFVMGSRTCGIQEYRISPIGLAGRRETWRRAIESYFAYQ